CYSTNLLTSRLRPSRSSNDSLNDHTTHLPAPSPQPRICLRLCHDQSLVSVEVCLHRYQFPPWPRTSRPKNAPPTWPPPSRLWPTRTVSQSCCASPMATRRTSSCRRPPASARHRYATKSTPCSTRTY